MTSMSCAPSVLVGAQKEFDVILQLFLRQVNHLQPHVLDAFPEQHRRFLECMMVPTKQKELHKRLMHMYKQVTESLDDGCEPETHQELCRGAIHLHIIINKKVEFLVQGVLMSFNLIIKKHKPDLDGLASHLKEIRPEAPHQEFKSIVRTEGHHAGESRQRG